MKNFDRLHWVFLVGLLGAVILSLVQSVTTRARAAGATESESEEDSGPTLVFLNDFTFPGEDLLLTPGPPDLFIGVDPDTLEPLMSYNVSEKRWTLSDRFLADVADALVPVLKERGFAPSEQHDCAVLHYDADGNLIPCPDPEVSISDEHKPVDRLYWKIVDYELVPVSRDGKTLWPVLQAEPEEAAP